MTAEVIPFSKARLETESANSNIRFFGGQRTPRYIDCGDERELTPACSNTRTEIPARHFGAASGLAIVTLNAIIMQNENGAALARQWLYEYENGLASLASLISTLAAKKLEVEVAQHSSDGIEQSGLSLRPDIDQDIGCAYNAMLGVVLDNAQSTGNFDTVRKIAEIDQSEGLLEDTGEARESYGQLFDITGGRSAKVSRSDIVGATRNRRRITPIAMVSGEHVRSEDASVVIDLAGFKARANGRDYFHSAVIPETILPEILPEFHLEERALRASSVLSAVATQEALGVQTTQVIPGSYAQAA